MFLAPALASSGVSAGSSAKVLGLPPSLPGQHGPTQRACGAPYAPPPKNSEGKGEERRGVAFPAARRWMLVPRNMDATRLQ